MQQQQGSGGSGQYGAPEVPQFVGGRGGHAHSHMLGISSHEMPHHSHSDHQQPQQQPQHHLQQSQQQLLQHSQPQLQQSNCNNQQQKTDSLAEIPSPIASRPPPPPPRSTNSFEQLVPLGSSFGDDEALAGDDGERGSSAGNRWPRQETLALLKIRSDMDAAFRDASLKGPLWEEVSRKLEELGYHRSAKKCKEKFENVHKYYKRTKDGRAGRQDGKSYRFFSQLEALHSNNNNSSSSNANNARNNYANAMDTGGGAAARLQAPSAVMLNNSNTTAELNRNASATVNPVVIKHSADFSAGISFSSESSEDDEYDDQTDSRKRKRGSSSTKKMMIFFETLMKQVMEKQELMQQKFLESIEKREQDRMIREEAWKRQEMARLNREHEIMAQERAISASRDAAFIAFLQKITGQNFQVPLMAPLAQSTTTLNPPPQEIQRRIGVDQEVHAAQLELSFDPNSTRWPKPEVHALIRLRSGMEPKYQDTGPKGPLWEEISAGMSRLGYIRSAKRCKEKWENINKYFKKVKESNKKRPEDAKTCPYFHQLDQLYRKRILSGNPNTNTSSKQDQLNQEETCIEPSGDNNNNNNNNDRTEGQSDDILAIMPPPVSSSDNTKNNNNGPASAMIPSSNGPVSAPFYSTTSAENATGADQRALKKPECLMMDMDLDDVMQSAQQHQQSVLDDYDKMEQEDSDTNNNLDDPDNITHDKQSTVDHLPFAQFVHERTSSSASTAANSFMAMVHRLAASDPPEFKSSKA